MGDLVAVEPATVAVADARQGPKQPAALGDRQAYVAAMAAMKRAQAAAKTAIIGTLAERHNANCVRRDLSTVTSTKDLHPALCRIVDSYYRMFIDEPVMRDVWQATRPTGRCRS